MCLVHKEFLSVCAGTLADELVITNRMPKVTENDQSQISISNFEISMMLVTSYHSHHLTVVGVFFSASRIQICCFPAQPVTVCMATLDHNANRA